MLRTRRFLRLLGSVHDLLAAAAAYILAYMIVLGWDGARDIPGFFDKIPLFAGGCAIVFYFCSLNGGSWRYASIPDLIAIVKASSIGVLGYLFIQFLYIRGEGLPRSVPVLMWLLLISLLAGPRLIFRLAKEGGVIGAVTGVSRPKDGSKQVLLYGMNEIAEAYIRAVRLRKNSDVFIAGILDDQPQNMSRMLQGQRVLGKSTDMKLVIELLAARGITVSELIVADNTMSTQELTALVGKSVDMGLKITRLPDILNTAAIRGGSNFEPKPLEVGDLLGRTEISMATHEVTRLIEGKTVLLTGAGGSIGSELARQISDFNPGKLIICDISEHFLYSIDLELSEKHPELRIVPRIADVRDRARIWALFEEFRPDIVFHAAALKHVPLMEENLIEAVKTNILGTLNCADASIEFGSNVFVMISTDKAVNPTNVMGATKRAAEAYCQTLDLKSEKTRFKTVRFGNVLGSNGSVVPRFAAQIAKGGPVTVTHPKILRYFMTLSESVTLVLQASAHGEKLTSERGKILVLEMGEPVLITELAVRMIQLAGLRPGVDIEIKYTGLRPGEKLFEELFDPSEIEENAGNESYRVATPRIVDSNILDRTLREMYSYAASENPRHLLSLLHKIVPEFRHSESPLTSAAAEIVPFKPRTPLV